MARRVSRRSEGELFIHNPWFRALSAAIAITISGVILVLARSSDNHVGYGLAILALALSITWAIRSLRYVFDR